MSTAAQGEGAAYAGLHGGAYAVTEPDGLGAAASKLNARAVVRCSAWLEQPDRLTVLTEKIQRGEGLAMPERLERQGLIFNHSGKCGKIIL